MAENKSIFKIVVTEADYDDMGAILKQMGLPYRVYDQADLDTEEAMRNVDILFINCQGPEPTWNAANNVRKLVDRGGALYVSCYARKWIDLIWPEYMDFHGNGEIQKDVYARIIDPGLQEFLGGNSLYLNYNTHWNGISKIKKRDGRDAVREYMRGQRIGWYEEEPLLVSFPYGEGFVIFTTFHNSVQVNELENLLLQYLVLKPLMARKTVESNTIIMGRRFTPTKEFLGALGVGEESKLHQFYVENPVDLLFIFNWEGKATTRISIFDPNGQPLLNENIRKQPYEMNIPNASRGNYTFKLKIVDAPLARFPYIINVGVKQAVEQALSQQKVIGTSSSTPAYMKLTGSVSVESISTPLNLPQLNQEQSGRTITLELIAPFRQSLGQFQINRGQKFSLGKEELPEQLHSDQSITSHHILIQLLDDTQLIIRDTAPKNYETAASTYTHGDLESHQMMTLTKNLPVAFKFPVLVLLGENVMIGLY